MKHILLSLALSASVHAAEKPNIVFILADDLGWGDVGFNGRTDWTTPNLDRLAASGTVFKRWYTGGVTCAPSRGVLMTGKYTIHNGVTGNSDDLPSEEITIPEALHTHGYTSALFGKWHKGNPRPGRDTYVHPLDHGFDEFFGFTEARSAWEHFPKKLWDGREEKSVEGYTATLFADRGIDFIKRQHAKKQPFFLYLPFTEPHLHIQAPAEDIAKFAGKFKEQDASDPVNATHAAMIHRLDFEIGRVLESIREAGIEKETLIVFTSDHGATFETGNKGASLYHDSNRPFRGMKRQLWEGGIRVPAIVSWPGKVPAGKSSEEVVHMIDVLPTLLSAVGGTPGAPVDGVDMLAVWQGEAPAPERTLFWEWRVEGANQVAAMRGDKKLVITGNTVPEMFHLPSDPSEHRTIAPVNRELVQEMKSAIEAWLATETDASRLGKKYPQ